MAPLFTYLTTLLDWNGPFLACSLSLLLTRATLLEIIKSWFLVFSSLLLLLQTSDSCRRRLFSEKLLGESDMEEGSNWKFDT